MSDTTVTRRFAAAAGAMSILAAYAPKAHAQEPKGMIYPVSFPSGSIELHLADHETIRAVASKMAQNPNLTAMVLGKADTVGSDEYNDHLSWKRASVVFEDLVFNNKVPATRVHMHWTGEKMLTVPTGDNAPDLLNRVVEIILE